MIQKLHNNPEVFFEQISKVNTNLKLIQKVYYLFSKHINTFLKNLKNQSCKFKVSFTYNDCETKKIFLNIIGNKNRLRNYIKCCIILDCRGGLKVRYFIHLIRTRLNLYFQNNKLFFFFHIQLI